MTQMELERRLAALEAENAALKAQLTRAARQRADRSASAAQAEVPPRATAAALNAALTRANEDLAQSRARLQASEDRYRAILESATDYAIFTTDLTGHVTSWNTGAERVLGWPADAIMGQDGAVIFTPEDRDAGAPDQERQTALALGRAVDERWHVKRDGTRFWGQGVLTPLRDGSLQGFLKILRDRTDRRRIEERLRESEARFRHMADSAPALIWMTDEEGRVTFANMHYDHIFGRPAAEMLGEGWRAIVVPEDVAAFEAAFLSAFAAREPFRAEVRVRDRAGEVRWLRCEGVARLDDAHRFLGYTGCNVDITQAKRAEAQREVMTRELHHRVKNTLATVQAIANATARQANSLDAFRASFTDRLVSLAKTHTLLMEHNWVSIPLLDLLTGELQPYEVLQDSGAVRVHLSGDPPAGVDLPSDTALALGLTVHELATNAAKYGALSVATGRLIVTWTLRHSSVGEGTAARGRLLELTWLERGGPPITAPPERKGFGSQLMRRMLTDAARGGSVDLAFEPEGLRATLVLPVDEAEDHSS
ncbi:MAG TPA: PAS domain S-box protein [Beijerinckiaceae bacterium]|jgi:PAS domain S-box-containing protein